MMNGFIRGKVPNIQEILLENEKLKNELKRYEKPLRRGDIVYLNKDVNLNSRVTTFHRPYLVISNNSGNYHSSIFIAVPLTTKSKKLGQPTHIKIPYNESYCLCEQIETFSQEQITDVVYNIPEYLLKDVEKGLKISLGMEE